MLYGPISARPMASCSKRLRINDNDSGALCIAVSEHEIPASHPRTLAAGIMNDVHLHSRAIVPCVPHLGDNYAKTATVGPDRVFFFSKRPYEHRTSAVGPKVRTSRVGGASSGHSAESARTASGVSLRRRAQHANRACSSPRDAQADERFSDPTTLPGVDHKTAASADL